MFFLITYSTINFVVLLEGSLGLVSYRPTLRVPLVVPLVVRLEGNNVEAGKKTLAESGLNLIPADDILDAAKRVVEAAKG